jgi:hypothetical protein
MCDTGRQNAAGKVLWHFTMSLDGFVAGRNKNLEVVLAHDRTTAP